MTAPGLLRFEYEAYLQRHGYTTIAGVDEVGRGALAGPIHAAAVILPQQSDLLADATFWTMVNDSKVLSPKKRALVAEGIAARAVATSISWVDAAEIDRIGIAPANRAAMEAAVRSLTVEADYLLIDAMTIEDHRPQTGIIDGDALSLSIAAASIVAKVARDTLMIGLDAQYPGYGFARNKGYGARVHLEELVRLGPCPIHRYSYAPVAAADRRRHE